MRKVIAPDAFLAALPRYSTVVSYPGEIYSAWQPTDEEPPYSRLSDATFGLLWPADAAARLDQLSPEGGRISGEDLAKYPLYRELFTLPGRGLRFLDGGYVYDGVRITRAEEETQANTRGGAR
jgi:hypothetical protein